MESVWGLWLFSFLIYQGQTIPFPNPTIKIQYEFFDTGINVLRYHRIDESGFCERRAAYTFNGAELLQDVVWVHPDNASWCSHDSDMRLGTHSQSKAWLKDGQFHLEVLMGEEALIYVWDKAKSAE